MRPYALLAALALAACSTPEARIKKDKAAFESWPPAVQESVRAGRADVGFTAEQARMALGRPDRVYTRKTAEAAQEVWAYGGGGGTRTGLSFGFGSGGWGSSYGLGVGVGGGDERPDDRVRVVFQDGRVVSVESREK
jgi:hypothetical protein